MVKFCQIWSHCCQMISHFWQDWIISPNEYEKFYCKGNCVFPLNSNTHPTSHAILQVRKSNLWLAEQSSFFKWPIPSLFFFIFTFSIQLTIGKLMFIIKFAHDWIQTADFWYYKQPLCPLSHNHSQNKLA